MRRVRVAEPGQVVIADGRVLALEGRVAAEDGGQLLAGDGGVRLIGRGGHAVDDAVGLRPGDSLGVIGRVGHVAEAAVSADGRRALKAVEYRGQHAAGEVGLGREVVRARAFHDALLVDEAHGLVVPVAAADVVEHIIVLYAEGDLHVHVGAGHGEQEVVIAQLRDLDAPAQAVRNGDAVHLIALVGIGGYVDPVALFGVAAGHLGVAVVAGDDVHSGPVGEAGVDHHVVGGHGEVVSVPIGAVLHFRLVPIAVVALIAVGPGLAVEHAQAGQALPRVGGGLYPHRVAVVRRRADVN